MIKVKAYKKDRKKSSWITLLIGKNRYRLSTEEAARLSVDLKLTLVFDRPEEESYILVEKGVRNV